MSARPAKGHRPLLVALTAGVLLGMVASTGPALFAPPAAHLSDPVASLRAVTSAASRGEARTIEESGHHQADANPDQPAYLPATHTVQPGESLPAVAERYGTTAKELARVNALPPGNVLQPGDELVLPRADAVVPATPEDAMAADLPLEQVLEATAAEFAWEPALIKAVAWRESRWNQRVVSHKGAVGIMQVQPATARVVEQHLGTELDLYHLADNVTAGVAYLDMLRADYDGDLGSVLTAYHQGPESLRTRGQLPITRRYIADVEELRERFAE